MAEACCSEIRGGDLEGRCFFATRPRAAPPMPRQVEDTEERTGGGVRVERAEWRRRVVDEHGEVERWQQRAQQAVAEAQSARRRRRKGSGFRFGADAGQLHVHAVEENGLAPS